MPKKEQTVKHLVIDTCVIIANASLHTLAEHYYAPPGVVDELYSQKARQIWDTLPFEVTLREPTNAGLRAVIEASKKTGDYKSLSVVDMKVIALAYDLNQQYVKEKEIEEVTEAENQQILDDINDKMKQCRVVDGSAAVAEPDDEDSDDTDDEGWITPDNIDKALVKLGGFEVEEDVLVGCCTTDFALQNVLLTMNLSLVALTGYRIRKLKSFVLRCRACYNTTSIMTKEFCPTCGHKMLHKCAVSVDENGTQQLHVNWNRMHNRRGMIYSLPNPKGGKHAVNEKLFEDQPMPQMRMAKVRADPLGDGPFAMHDVTSRSAIRGIRTMTNRSRNNRNRNEGKGGRRK
ncbi:unnamed protein product [Caenorhabditis bovis]|uniref:RNA-binding protein NOB1 n=1 Tax=Caenorhabditis bovis TaxID=2654633 RepID=A0A8S1F2K7_9PELO|nr:unnamed protein product [Caenorhabditis bovis]